MPTSTAETTMRASSFGASPASLTGMRSVVSGRIRAGRSSATPIVCAALSMLNHCTPMARPGMRFSAASSGRLSVAST